MTRETHQAEGKKQGRARFGDRLGGASKETLCFEPHGAPFSIVPGTRDQESGGRAQVEGEQGLSHVEIAIEVRVIPEARRGPPEGEVVAPGRRDALLKRVVGVGERSRRGAV